MTTTLTEIQHQLLQQYTGLLETIEEAFDYVSKSFENYELTEGDRILGDIFSAFGQLASTNVQVANLYFENRSIQEKVYEFESVIKILNPAEINLTDPVLKQQIINDKLSPAFTAWSRNIQNVLKPYIES
ncbi:hypothetical protein [Peribacillus glennii]|uniref:DUF8042 domain-containing protein n=1 Tax=Peribacillus glennii TaxID=2303991 RepID=A0A372LE05_9BACI|nr:hypothetical protein [Peribacillus glennii]RFU63938.1 hypothetical protein D0466_10845 [Peribacillus glennii]